MQPTNNVEIPTPVLQQPEVAEVAKVIQAEFPAITRQDLGAQTENAWKSDATGFYE